MRRSEDTSVEAHERQLGAYRAMSPEKRLRLAAEMSADVRALAIAGGRARSDHAARLATADSANGPRSAHDLAPRRRQPSVDR